VKLSDYRTSNGVLLSGAPDFPQRDFWGATGSLGVALVQLNVGAPLLC